MTAGLHQHAVYTVKVGETLQDYLANADVKCDATAAEGADPALDANRDSPDLFPRRHGRLQEGTAAEQSERPPETAARTGQLAMTVAPRKPFSARSETRSPTLTQTGPSMTPKLDPVKLADWEIAEAAEPFLRPIAEVAADPGSGTTSSSPYGELLSRKSTRPPCRAGSVRRPSRQVHRRHGHHPNRSRRRQDHHHFGARCRASAKASAPWHGPPAERRPHLQHQGVGRGRRPRAGRPAHAALAGPHRRHRRHH